MCVCAAVGCMGDMLAAFASTISMGRVQATLGCGPGLNLMPFTIADADNRKLARRVEYIR